jgi:hydrogenase-4 component B
MTAPTHLWALLAVLGIFAMCAVLAALLYRRSLAFVYPVCIAAAVVACSIDAWALFAASEASIHLPLGLPWIGVRLRLDALSAYFGLIVNIGVVAAALYGLGFDRRHELSGRVEPFFPAFAAAMCARRWNEHTLRCRIRTGSWLWETAAATVAFLPAAMRALAPWQM